jgi:Tfp pilus assembly PilM family ATPase
MAKSCGIHVDRRRFRVVALDGSAKKHKVVGHGAGEVRADDDPDVAVAKGLKRLAKEQGLRDDSVGLAIDSGRAAFRTLTLPFDERAKIEEVIKFEIENDLPQWSIDDVIVDFLVLDSKPGVQSRLLVTAVQKETLARDLEVCEASGLEAHEAELDGTALYNAAHAAGVLDPEGAQILVHVGDASTTVVLCDGGRLQSMRAIRAGALPLAAEATGETVPVAPPEEGGDVELGLAPPESEDEPTRTRRLEQTAQRIVRELGRTLSAARTEHPIEAIYLSGYDLPGLWEERFFDVPTRVLEPPALVGIEGARELVIAYGSALRQLGGGVLRPRLRREELRYSGTFERLELPLAVCSLLLFTLLAVQLIVVNKRIGMKDEGDLAAASPNPGDLQLWLESSNRWMFPDPELGWPGRLKSPPEDILDYAREAARGEDEERTKFEEIDEIRKMLSREINRLQKDLGQISEIVQPQSALKALALVMGEVLALDQQVGRFGLREVKADYIPGRGGGADYVQIQMDIDFFAQDDVTATAHYTNLVNTLEGQPWCIEVVRKPTKVLEGGAGIAVDGMTVKVDLTRVPEKAAVAAG